MHQWVGSSLVQVMACRLFGTKPLPVSILSYSQLNSGEQISVRFELEFCHFHSRKFIWTFLLQKTGNFIRGRWVKIQYFLPKHIQWNIMNMLFATGGHVCPHPKMNVSNSMTQKMLQIIKREVLMHLKSYLFINWTVTTQAAFIFNCL